jgi:hypothetical protein
MTINTDDLEACAEAVASKLDADVLFYSGFLAHPWDDYIIDECFSRARRPNVLLLLCTFGGSPDAAYRIARCLQQQYERFTVLVGGYCKSAGTLMVLGADDVVLMRHAELGPLDVQLLKQDEPGERSSGLTPLQAFLSLDAQTQVSFQQTFLSLKEELQLTTKTAADCAVKLVTDLYRGIYSQVDPMRLGEMQRAQQVALFYGNRLMSAKNFRDDGLLQNLVSTYPAHSFVIDAQEARELFKKRVRDPSPQEIALTQAVGPLLRRHGPKTMARPAMFFLNKEAGDARTEAEGDEQRTAGEPPPGDHSRAEPAVNGGQAASGSTGQVS